jgi:hypothetical protein
MAASETHGLGETEADAPSWLVRFHDVPNRTVPPICTNTKRTIEAHWGPPIKGPQHIVLRGEKIDQLSCCGRGRTQPTFMNVGNTHPFTHHFEALSTFRMIVSFMEHSAL